MKLALECPTPLLDLIQPFADFDWILADKVRDEPVYANFYRESNRQKILDNSVTEKGEPLDIDTLIEIANDINADLIVSPDWLNDRDKTITGYLEAIQKVPPDKLVGVLQGASPEEALECLSAYQHRLILVPYRVGGSLKSDPAEIMSLRRRLVVSRIPADRNVHLLGFTNLDELSWYEHQPNVLSLDTDVPIRSGLMCQDFDDFDRTTDTSKVKLVADNWAGICRNIALLRRYMA